MDAVSKFSPAPRLAAIAQFARFLGVGAATLVINSALLALCVDRFGINYLVGAALATQGASVCGFLLTEFWVFGPRRVSQGWPRRFLLFMLMNNIVLALRTPLLYAFTSVLHLHYLISNALSIVILTTIRYLLADNLIWRKRTGARGSL